MRKKIEKQGDNLALVFTKEEQEELKLYEGREFIIKIGGGK